MRICVLVSLLFVPVVTSPALAQTKNTLPPKLTEKTYPVILKALQKPPVKTYWREIPWRPDFGVAITHARKADKPILLWVMNGHPCGMT